MIWGTEYFYSDFNNFNVALKKGKKYKETKKSALNSLQS